MSELVLFAPQALIDGRWQPALLRARDGVWTEITPQAQPPAGATTLGGPALPGVVNGHSHAFQRAFAGLAERLPAGGADDFWAWRDRMYGVALRVGAEDLRAIAAQLFVELLRGGYTEVCEFHYLLHDRDGRPYPEPATLALALVEAAVEVGIGLTVLPVLYTRAGFSDEGLRDDQRRFASSPALVAQVRTAVQAARRPLVSAGVAIHSLRAARPEAIATLLQQLGDDPGPVHIHVAEQTREVDDCLRATGARPVEWLCRTYAPDARWQLVHATHVTPAEIDAVARSGAGVVVCPSTEANLGDGLTDLPRWLAAGVPLGIGSDSQVSRNLLDELRWLEYGQRLRAHRRNLAATADSPTAARLFAGALAGGARAAGQARAGLVVGARADLVVLDAQAPGLLGAPATHVLDAAVFASDGPVVDTVYVAGTRVLAGGRHPRQDAIAAAFCRTMNALW